jgi:hypothetical protein
VLFSRYLYENFGHLQWAEAKLGPGGTLTFIRLVGIGGIVLGFMLWFGIFQFVFGGIIETLFGGLREPLQEQKEREENLRSLLPTARTLLALVGR